ncbi:MAG: glycoside hydrolase family 3 C-terminal domain-containing protein [Christensenellaceae bacterium]
MTKQIKEILSKMSLEQKASLCSGADAWNTHAIESAGIPSVLMTDGPHGLRKQYDEKTAMFEHSMPATCFPAAASTACSWDRQLLKEMGTAFGKEAADQGVQLVLGPGVNMKRSPLCGRNFEYFSEDPVLAGELAAGLIEGIQSTGTGACIKHFVANNRESFRMVSNSMIDERALHEVYLAGFERAIKKSKPFAVMSAYNMLNGVYCGENKELIHDILRQEWGYDGVVISDWGAVYNRERGIAAGMDIEMPYSGEENTERIIKSVQNKTLDEQDLDDCVMRILKFVFRCKEQKPDSTFSMQNNHDTARKVAQGSVVLLKNENVLPLKKGMKVALIGEFAKNPRYQGAGSSMINPSQLENIAEEFKKQGIDFVYAQGYETKQDEPNEKLILQAQLFAEQSDVAVIVAGLPPRYEMEGIDRKHMDMPNNQNELIARIAKNKPTIVLLCTGAPVLMPWLDDVAGLVHCYLGGQAGASAVTSILTGEVNPSGKLAETYPLRLEANPSYCFFNDDRHNVEYRESIYVGYKYYQATGKKVLFPFGFGLSYTTFAYSDLKLSQETFIETLNLSVAVKNTGKRAGAEVVQLYVGRKGQPEKKLVGFEKVFLESNEQKTVQFELGARDFSFYEKGWKLYEDAQIFVGSSCEDLKLSADITIPNGNTVPDYPPCADGHWDTDAFHKLFEKMPLISFSTHPFTVNATLTDFEATPIGRFVRGFVKKFAKKFIPTDSEAGQEIMLQLLEENPMRAMVSLSGGMFTYGMSRGVLMIVNGNILMGILALFTANRKRKKQTTKK